MRRALVNSGRNIRRSPYQALASVLVLGITLFIAQVFVLLTYGSQVVLQYFETRPQVTAFFKDEVSDTDVLALKEQLEQQPYVASVTFISKEEALRIYREDNKDDPLLLEMVTADILPALLEVSAKEAKDLMRIKTDLEAARGVDEVVYHQNVVEAIQKWTSGLRVTGVVIILFLSFTSLLVTTIIISMKVASKREEITTMRLLGATNWFINGPFVVEGAFYGVVSAVVSWLTTYILLLYATPVVVDFVGDIPVLPIDYRIMVALLVATTLLAAMMGMVSGLFSSRRFGR